MIAKRADLVRGPLLIRLASETQTKFRAQIKANCLKQDGLSSSTRVLAKSEEKAEKCGMMHQRRSNRKRKKLWSGRTNFETHRSASDAGQTKKLQIQIDTSHNRSTSATNQILHWLGYFIKVHQQIAQPKNQRDSYASH